MAGGKAPVAEGDVLAGKYRVERILGKGGMGVVVAARHLQLEERVALKFLLPDLLFNTEVVSRFAREAKAAAKIRSEHVARVTDVGSLENGAPFLVMEYLEGTDLSRYLESRRSLPLLEAVDYVLQACEAIAEAHGLGIIHRDLKPSNLFLSRRADGSACIKVLDFGISKMLSASGEAGQTSGAGMTATSASLGSPLYMSPEQMTAAKTVDTRTDVWALGVILFELLTGTQPFMANSLPDLYIAIATLPPRSLRAYRPDLPIALEHVIQRCLEKDMRRRFSHTGDLAKALAPFAPPHALISVERILRTAAASGPQLPTALPTSEGRTVAMVAMMPTPQTGPQAAQPRAPASDPSLMGPQPQRHPQFQPTLQQEHPPQQQQHQPPHYHQQQQQQQQQQALARMAMTPASPAATAGAWGTTLPIQNKTRSIVVGAVALSVVVILVIALPRLLRSSTESGEAGSASANASTNANANANANASTSAVSAVSLPASATASAPATDTAGVASNSTLIVAQDAGGAGAQPTVRPGPAPLPLPLPSKEPPIPPTPTPSQNPLPNIPTAPTATAPNDCNPNYYLDADGNKHFKPKCFPK